MGQPGRNDPCRCGSGKKYKRCCLPGEEAAEHAALRAAREAAEASVRADAEQRRAVAADWKARREQALKDLDFIDESNAVLALIRAGHLEEAERAAHVLIERYPDTTDGLERLGHVYEVRGDVKMAAKYYRDALDLGRRRGFPEDEDFATLRAFADRLDPP